MTSQPAGSPNPALSMRAAMDWVRQHAPQDWQQPEQPLRREHVATDFAVRFAGVPANSRSRAEKVVSYRIDDAEVPVVLGLYGCADRVRGWLPGLPGRTTRAAVEGLLEAAAKVPPQRCEDPPCQQEVETTKVDLTTLPALTATPRDAGPYLTMGLLYAHDPASQEVALSVHRMLVLDQNRLALWMVPGRRLRAMHENAVRRTGRLAVSVNIGAPPAALIASAVNTSVLPAGFSKLAVAGALAGAPVELATAVSQPTSVLAESEIVLEGYLDHTVADEAVHGAPDVSLPEFLGYDGEARSELPVLTVTAVTTRRAPAFQAVIGPGREQSVILGLAGALSVALSGSDQDWQMISDLHYAPAGGGMLLLVIALRKDSPGADRRLKHIARRIFDQHGFVKLIVFTDEDVDITSSEDVLWAITTRANLGTDCGTFAGFRPLAMDPSQGQDWSTARGTDGASGRTYIDATVPYPLRATVTRSFPALVKGARP